jgi:hypothetical protein
MKNGVMNTGADHACVYCLVLTRERVDSEIVHFSIMHDHVVVLNSAEAASDMFEKRSAIYSDRPWMTMSSEMHAVCSLTAASMLTHIPVLSMS